MFHATYLRFVQVGSRATKLKKNDSSPCCKDRRNFHSESCVPAERCTGHQDLPIATGYEQREKKEISTCTLMCSELKISSTPRACRTSSMYTFISTRALLIRKYLPGVRDECELILVSPVDFVGLP